MPKRDKIVCVTIPDTVYLKWHARLRRPGSWVLPSFKRSSRLDGKRRKDAERWLVDTQDVAIKAGRTLLWDAQGGVLWSAREGGGTMEAVSCYEASGFRKSVV